MKKIVKFAASLLFIAGAMVSCKKEAFKQELDANVPTSFTASFDDATKLSIDGFKPVFEVGDELIVYADNSATATFEVKSVSESGAATFGIKGSWSKNPSEPYFVCNGELPTMTVNPWDGNAWGITGPEAILNAKPNDISLARVIGFADNLNEVKLFNVSSLFKITVPTEVKALRFATTSQYGIILTQIDADYDFTNKTINAYTDYHTNDGVEAITFTSNNGESLPAGTYYIPIFPQTFTDGLKVAYTANGTDYYWKEKTNTFTTERSKIYDLGNLSDWPQAEPEPIFAVEDIVGDWKGDVKFGNQHEETFQASQYTGAKFAIEESDNADKGNVKFTKFLNTDCSFYATLDLYTGSVTILAGTSIRYDSGSNLSVIISSDVVLNLSEDKERISLAQHTILGPHQYMGADGYNVAVDPFTLTKNTPEPPTPEGPAVADFVGKFQGAYNANYVQATSVNTVLNVEFILEEISEGDYNVAIKKIGDKTCEVKGILDTNTGLLRFAAGQNIPYPENNILSNAKPLYEELQLQFSNDKNSLVMVNTTCLINNQMPPTYGSQITKIELTRVIEDQKPFNLSIMTDNQWVVSYKANGVAKTENSGSNTQFQKQSDAATAATGCNLFISYFMCGYNSGYANLNEDTGELTIPQARNSGALYWPAIDWASKTLTSDIVMQISEDKSKVVATASFTLSDGTVISDYTFTKAN